MTEAPQAPVPPAGGPVANPGKGLGIAGMVLGIVALVLFCVWYLAIPCAIVGLILSIIGKGKSKAAGAPTGMATAGMVTSIIALALDIILGLLLWSFISAMFSFGQQIAEDANRMNNLVDVIRLLL